MAAAQRTGGGGLNGNLIHVIGWFVVLIPMLVGGGIAYGRLYGAVEQIRADMLDVRRDLHSECEGVLREAKSWAEQRITERLQWEDDRRRWTGGGAPTRQK